MKDKVNDFCDLVVWKKGHNLAIQIYKITRDFPREEMFGLVSQVRRSVSSICANISEGFGRYHPKDKIRFYYTARGSISESKNHILLARDLGYISSDTSAKLIEELETVKKMLNGLINSLRRYDDRGF